MEDDRPSAVHVDQEEAEEDALPDWTQFAKFAK
jgi:tRNA-splicing endonuclease subunit Sen54